MMLDPATLLAVFGMALATYATRISGLWLMQRLAVKGRLGGALEALPPAVLMAVIAPAALATGPAETIAALVTAIVATRLPMLATITIGVVCAALLRRAL